jgi:glycerate kinase
VALAGTLGDGYEEIHEQGVDACFSICPGPLSLEDALENAGALLERAAEQAVRAFLAGRRGRTRADGTK